MKILGTKDGEAQVILSADDIHMFQSAIRETLEAVQDWEFHARVGFTRAEMMEMFHALNNAQAQIGK